MEDNNVIKPVEGLQNIGAVTPTKQRKESKQRQNLHEQNEDEPEQQADDLTEQNDTDSEITTGEKKQNIIDYCA